MRSCCKLKNVAVLTTIPFFLALQSHHAGWLHGYYQNPLLSASLYGTAGFATAALLLLLLLNGKTRHSRELLRIINTDPVTGGLSFSKFRSDASKLLQNGKQDYALVYADIQNFKYMNDTYGRSHGDETLKSISEILEASLVQGELAARPYADHFVLLLKAGNADGLMARLTDLWQSASDRISQNQECRILFKTGVSLFDPQEPGMNVDKALDQALYAMNTLGRLSENGVAFFSREMSHAAEREKDLERCMNDALQQGEFVPYYQPKVDLATGKIIGSEALARWFHPVRGLIPPGDFIPFFEKNNFIIKFDFSIFEAVCRHQNRLLELGIQTCPVSVNFSRRHLRHPEWSDRLKEIVSRHALRTELFELELTETVAENDLSLLSAAACKLKADGFRISIDDFGAGYSSLQLLYRIPIDVLKLDKSCLSSVRAPLMEHEILSSLIDIAQRNQIQVIWEGVENQQQEDFIKQHGCTRAQGFYYARPMPFEEYASVLRKGTLFRGAELEKHIPTPSL